MLFQYQFLPVQWVIYQMQKMVCYTLKQVHQIENKSYIQNVYHRKM